MKPDITPGPNGPRCGLCGRDLPDDDACPMCQPFIDTGAFVAWRAWNDVGAFR